MFGLSTCFNQVYDDNVLEFVEGGYSLIIYVGIDISKPYHFTAIITSDDEIFIDSFQFTNDYDGFWLLLSNLIPLDQDSIIIAIIIESKNIHLHSFYQSFQDKLFSITLN